MNRKKWREKLSCKQKFLSRLPEGFYKQPILHINCTGEVTVENCKAVLEYEAQKLRLDMGSWDAAIWGDDLKLVGLGGSLLRVKGTVFKTELFYKGKEK